MLKSIYPLTIVLSISIVSAVCMISVSYGALKGQDSNPSQVPLTSPPAIDSPHLLITKRVGQVKTIPPGGLSTLFAFCKSDERITGGGYISSGSGIKIKDLTIVTAGGDDDTNKDVQLVGGEKWHVNAINDDPNQSLSIRAVVFCGKLVK